MNVQKQSCSKSLGRNLWLIPWSNELQASFLMIFVITPIPTAKLQLPKYISQKNLKSVSGANVELICTKKQNLLLLKIHPLSVTF